LGLERIRANAAAGGSSRADDFAPITVTQDDVFGTGDQSFLMSFSAASWASASEAKSLGVTTLRTVSP
jgi:hypothetical protein